MDYIQYQDSLKGCHMVGGYGAQCISDIILEIVMAVSVEATGLFYCGSIVV